MSRTKQEVRDFLNSLVGQKVNAKCGIYNGQCVSLIKALLEFLGVPDPYKGRGNATDVGDYLLAEGVAQNGAGWLTVVINHDMGRIFENGVWNNYGHIWLDLKDEANFEQNGAKALYTTKNTRPISQGQQFVNLDKYIKEMGMDLPTAQELALYIRIGNNQTLEKANANNKYDSEHIVADVKYSVALAKACYEEMELERWKAAHYDEQVKIAYDNGYLAGQASSGGGSYVAAPQLFVKKDAK